MADVNEERALAERLHAALGPLEAQPPVKRLRMRLRELGDNVGDEVRQFRLLQRTCREAPEVAAALAGAGFPGVAEADPMQSGALVQGFNRMVEARWGG
jgi:hypothetical protein